MLMEVCSDKGLWRMAEDLHMGLGGLFYFSLFEVLMGVFIMEICYAVRVLYEKFLTFKIGDGTFA
jgi:hypothetical protein